MATATVYSAIRAQFTTYWTATAVRWENERFDLPEPPAPWVAVEMTGTLYDQASLGAGVRADELWREEGILWMHVMVPAGSGAETARTLAGQLCDLFRGVELDPNIEFRGFSIGLGEPGDDDGNWYRISISSDWIRN